MKRGALLITAGYLGLWLSLFLAYGSLAVGCAKTLHPGPAIEKVNGNKDSADVARGRGWNMDDLVRRPVE